MRASIIALMVCAVLCAAGLAEATAGLVVAEGSAAAAAQKQASVTLKASTAEVLLPCPEGTFANPSSCDPKKRNPIVKLSASAKDFDGRKSYVYFTTGGRIEGEGAKVNWDLSGKEPGTYTATVEVADERGHRASVSVVVEVKQCQCQAACPTIDVIVPTNVVRQGTRVEVSANVRGASRRATYNWSVSAGRISHGQGTPTITIDTSGLGDTDVTVALAVGGSPPECEYTRSSAFTVRQ
ncbi:MAG TPA: hypothetical protein VGC89_11380 [Pyrinomonadaceae bacterium]|jgi:hypothetical protein